MQISFIDFINPTPDTALLIFEKGYAVETIFDLTDEKTITNLTVKITAAITGVVGQDSREQIEAKCRVAIKQIFPDATWSFSNFSFLPDGLTYRVQATTRIDTSLNEKLTEKTDAASTSDLRVNVISIDPSIPVHDIRAGESELRRKIISLAQDEANAMAGIVTKIDFTKADAVDRNMRAFGGSNNATYAASSSAESAPLGHSEKIAMTATVTVKIG